MTHRRPTAPSYRLRRRLAKRSGLSARGIEALAAVLRDRGALGFERQLVRNCAWYSGRLHLTQGIALERGGH